VRARQVKICHLSEAQRKVEELLGDTPLGSLKASTREERSEELFNIDARRLK